MDTASIGYFTVKKVHSAHIRNALLYHSAGAYAKWIHRFGQHDIGLHINENLGLEAGTYHGKRRNTTRI
jgi:hypothetical protein